VGITTKFNPQILDADHLSETLRPEKIGPAFIKRDDVFVSNLRKEPFLFSPDTRAVRPEIALVTIFEEFHPAFGVALGQRLQIVPHFQ